MAKNEDIVIVDFSQGIAPSPHVGFGDMRNLDITSVPGVALINHKLTKISDSTITGLIRWLDRNPDNPNDIAALDQDQKLYLSEDGGVTWQWRSGNTTDGSVGNGMKIWHDYVIVAKNVKLQTYGPLSGSAVWTNTFKDIDHSSEHAMHISRSDGILYGVAGSMIYSLAENAGQTFAPGNSATYTWTQQALDLPKNRSGKCLEDLGNNLMIGTEAGAGATKYGVADIFPWDRSSPSFDLPLALNVKGVHAMLNINNILYILAGVEGRVYTSNGVQSSIIAELPFTNYDDSVSTRGLVPRPNGIMNHKGRPFFTHDFGLGVWSILPTPNGTVLNLENTLPDATYTSSNPNAPALLSISEDEYMVAWQDSASPGTIQQGISKIENTLRGTNYGAYLESPLYRIGSSSFPRKIQEVEFQLAKKLEDTQGVALYYRTSLTDDFAIIGTYTHSSTSTTQIGAVASHKITELPIVESEFIQIKAALNPGGPQGESGQNASPNLRSIILR